MRCLLIRNPSSAVSLAAIPNTRWVIIKPQGLRIGIDRTIQGGWVLHWFDRITILIGDDDRVILKYPNTQMLLFKFSFYISGHSVHLSLSWGLTAAHDLPIS
jgi:hypothetical protein